MTYTPINWQNGDTITAEKMNKMDNGWGDSETQLFSETVTTAALPFGNIGSLSYVGQVTSDEITVTFDGTEYQCSAVQISTDGEYGYGGVTSEWEYDFTTYPFALVFSPIDGNILATQTAGTFTVAASGQVIAVSDSFNAAVNECVDTSSMPFICIDGTTTYEQMANATDRQRPMFFYANGGCFLVTRVAINGVSFTPSSQYVSASFVNDIFTVTVS